MKRAKKRFFLHLYNNFYKQEFMVGSRHLNEDYIYHYIRRNTNTLDWVKEYCIDFRGYYAYEVLEILGGIWIGKEWCLDLVTKGLESDSYAVRNGCLSAIDRWSIDGDDYFLDILTSHKDENDSLEDYRKDIISYIKDDISYYPIDKQ